MSSHTPSWIGRKGRSQKDNPARDALELKQASYANSKLLCDLNNIASLFTEEQCEIASSTGFRSFAKPFHTVQFDRQFTVWLLSKVDTMSRSIGVCIGKRLMMFQEHAAQIFGIPSSGKEVWDSTLDKSQEMRNNIEDIIGMGQQMTSPNEAARKTLRSLAGRTLSSVEKIKFKVSFTVTAVSLLCDSTNPGDKDSVNYWPALKDHCNIHNFNWASYVLDAVFSACASARMATRTNRCYSPPAGTALFLQVIR
jgi:hypothetical protein